MPVSKCVTDLNPAREHVEPQPFRPQLVNAFTSATAEIPRRRDQLRDVVHRRAPERGDGERDDRGGEDERTDPADSLEIHRHRLNASA